jgi:hypothetical protein
VLCAARSTHLNISEKVTYAIWIARCLSHLRSLIGFASFRHNKRFLFFHAITFALRDSERTRSPWR